MGVCVCMDIVVVCLAGSQAEGWVRARGRVYLCLAGGWRVWVDVAKSARWWLITWRTHLPILGGRCRMKLLCRRVHAFVYRRECVSVSAPNVDEEG